MGFGRLARLAHEAPTSKAPAAIIATTMPEFRDYREPTGEGQLIPPKRTSPREVPLATNAISSGRTGRPSKLDSRNWKPAFTFP